MISILTPYYLSKEIKPKKMFNIISNENIINDQNNKDDRFIKLLNDKYEKKDKYVYNSKDKHQQTTITCTLCS